ncbi:adenosylcobalamin-dependent ribonucleoside-diphosphate reductase [Candidatus Methanocrinis natronophilus]|uniref:Vitamin B12-dependent ribonucleotide reductase n=1 Tax=Candidatus Methanocrinis natronophilus TaxID=3033396 RepID=A0ABT5X942_9EURY|nr:adenosylcobalamin-dependent ribonucleoside-diphosphate reductase [Candidatus Methanocrinis natronophilus]MDF0591224.1 adenosylcobalamin-dependent ribonucleoside-diphosphate reductase [Candidatus Methanocrinis natronophilus]
MDTKERMDKEDIERISLAGKPKKAPSEASPISRPPGCPASGLGPFAPELLRKRYLRRDLSGNVAETADEMFGRVARTVGRAEGRFGGDATAMASRFREVMAGGLFLPNSPTLMNAGLALGQLSACFVLPVKDSMDGIFGALKEMAKIHQSGGGTGFSFSRLRPKGDPVRATGGVASGPVSFMEVFDAATEVIKQGGRRRGANMAVLRADHPDILDFVRAKERAGRLQNFNLSVGITDDQMRRARSGEEIDLINPRTGQVAETIDASDLLREIASHAWRRGDPGVLFLDRINESHPLPGTIEATNPCGEQPLLPYESCNLGSVNLSRFAGGGEIDWDGLEETARLAIRFLDDVLEVNRFPLKKIREATLKSRKIGLGVMGFAEMLIKLEISYASKEAVGMAEEAMKFIAAVARDESRLLGEERGSFPLLEESSLEWDAMRNATVTTIAPTGSISLIAGTSPGIEPLFGLSYSRDLLGEEMVATSPLFERMAKDRGLLTDDLIRHVAGRGTLDGAEGVPDDLKELFVTAMEVAPAQHVKIQAAFQRFTDNGVSKTVNLPPEATVEDVLNIFALARDLGCKGITVYRYGSRDQLLHLGEGRGTEADTDPRALGCRICD